MRKRRLVVTLLAVAAAIGILALLAPDSAGSGSFVALHRFLPGVGVPISDAAAPPGAGTFVLPADERSDLQIDALLSWVDNGGRLVVTDPSSALFDRFDVTTSRVAVVGDATLATDCVRTETLGVASIEVSASDRLLTSTQGAGCFARGDGSYALFIPHGQGTVVLVGGSSFMSDRSLNHADNAEFAMGVLGQGPVVMGTPSAPGPAVSVWTALPTGAKAVIWELIVAAGVFALARGRRIGRPVEEEPVSPIPSGELVHATARLYRSAKAVAFCGAVLRGWTADRLTRRTGVAPDADRGRLSVAIGRAAGVPVDDLEHALAGPDPADEEQLVALGQELETIATTIEGAPR